MSKAVKGLQGRFAANAARGQAGLSAGGTATMLEQMLPNFGVMLDADNCDGLDDIEVRIIKDARKDLRKAIKRLRGVERNIKKHPVRGN